LWGGQSRIGNGAGGTIGGLEEGFGLAWLLLRFDTHLVGITDGGGRVFDLTDGAPTFVFDPPDNSGEGAHYIGVQLVITDGTLYSHSP